MKRSLSESFKSGSVTKDFQKFSRFPASSSVPPSAAQTQEQEALNHVVYTVRPYDYEDVLKDYLKYPHGYFDFPLGRQVSLTTGGNVWKLDVVDFSYRIMTEEMALNLLIDNDFASYPDFCGLNGCTGKIFKTDIRPRRLTIKTNGGKISKTICHLYVFCKNCHKKHSLKELSWLKHFSQTSYRSIAWIIYYFMKGIPAFEVVKKLAMKKIDPDVVKRLYTFLRLVIQWYNYYEPIAFVTKETELIDDAVIISFGRQTVEDLLKEVENIRKYGLPSKQDAPEITTGPKAKNLIVVDEPIHVDESVFGKVKDHKVGTDTQSAWCFGIVTAKGAKAACYLIPNRKAKTLLKYIAFHVHSDCVIHTDCLASYNFIKPFFEIEHKTVNHTYRLKEPDGTHTNGVEGFWGMLKVHLAYSHGVSSLKSLREHIDQFCFFRNYQDENGCIADKLISILKDDHVVEKACGSYKKRYKKTN